jgi:hypothetical protein
MMLMGIFMRKVSGLITTVACIVVTCFSVQAQTLRVEVAPGESIEAALAQARLLRGKHGDAMVELRLAPGVYHVSATLTLTAADSNTRIVCDEPGGASLRAGRVIRPDFKPFRDGILQVQLPAGLEFEQLFVDGRRQPMARYPNFDAAQPIYNGYASDAIDADRIKHWTNPIGGYLHAQQRARWSGYSFLITGVHDDGSPRFRGGYQDNRCPNHRYAHNCSVELGSDDVPVEKLTHKDYRFVENVFEELDAPGEWFLDKRQSVLYYMPASGVDVRTASFEIDGPARIIEVLGTQDKPVRNVAFVNVDFRHAGRTFMLTDEPLTRSDWRIARQAALFMEGVEDVLVDGCTFQRLGGNALFVSGYGRRVRIVGAHIHDVGASAVAFVGRPAALRRDYYAGGVTVDNVDMTPGPKTDDYPADCVVEQSLIHDFGTVEKQSAGVQIDIASRITVRHCSIYRCPRAGINIGSGHFGGHVIEFCDVFDTVLETHDHGAFNCWGRDRFWKLKGADATQQARMARLDVVEPITLRDSRWRCDHGWDIDLDDGACNYRIVNNLMLAGGLKFGQISFHCVAQNNICSNGTLSAHVWPPHNHHEITRNIFTAGPYRDARATDWGDQVDHNVLSDEQALAHSRKLGVDQHSVAGDPMFLDPANGDFRVGPESPALKLGFENFDMNRFGVTLPRLRRLANTPSFAVGKAAPRQTPAATLTWRGATIKTLSGLDEQSATAVSEQRGVYFVNVPAGSDAEKAGLRGNDVVLSVDGKRVNTAEHFLKLMADSASPAKVGLWREQAPLTTKVAR